MDDRIFDIAELVSKYMTGELTTEEQKCLDDWLILSGENRQWFDVVRREELVWRKHRELKSIDVAEGWNALSRKRRRKRNQQLWGHILRYACAFIILSVPAIYFFTQDIDRDITIAVVDSEIVPGASKAILYMANGSIVDLGIHQQDTLREEDGTIIGLHGESITYTNTTDSTIRENLYNELVIPRGGEYVLTLSDGTVVCLNAGSKLRFPVQFNGSTRRVELVGEGYFQVVHDEKIPFVVWASGVDITVLGTEFNVSNCPESKDVQTTLIEGKVSVTPLQCANTHVLLPGEQAMFDKKSGKITVAEVDVSCVVAWKEGRLRFRDRPLKEIMDFISRWYDIDIVYEDEEVKECLFGCNFNRHVTVLPLLELFESTGTVHFEIVGKKIIVRK